MRNNVSLEIAISPAGRLRAEPAPELAPRVEDGLARRVVEAFEAGNARGLLHLATDSAGLPLPPSLAYWRDFARAYIQRLCHQPLEPSAPAPLLPIEPAETARTRPPGATHARRRGVPHSRCANPALGRAGRIAPGGDRRDGLRPVARNALSAMAQRRPRDIPPRREQARRAASVCVPRDLHPSPLRAGPRAASAAVPRPAGVRGSQEPRRRSTACSRPCSGRRRTSKLVQELVESRRIFPALGLDAARGTPSSSRKSPRWRRAACWCACPIGGSAASPPPAGAGRKSASRPAGGLLGAENLLDFSVDVALDGETLSKAEWKQIAAAKSGLALLRGKWVEIDAGRLQAVLAQWREVGARPRAGRLLFGRDAAACRDRPRLAGQGREPRLRRKPASGRKRCRASGSGRRSQRCAARRRLAGPTQERLARQPAPVPGGRRALAALPDPPWAGRLSGGRHGPGQNGPDHRAPAPTPARSEAVVPTGGGNAALAAGRPGFAAGQLEERAGPVCAHA